VEGVGSGDGDLGDCSSEISFHSKSPVATMSAQSQRCSLLISSTVVLQKVKFMKGNCSCQSQSCVSIESCRGAECNAAGTEGGGWVSVTGSESRTGTVARSSRRRLSV
jgi:hypothetical protein